MIKLEKKICPLLHEECKKNCEWFDKEEKCCMIKTIFWKLETIINELELNTNEVKKIKLKEQRTKEELIKGFR